MLTIGIIVLIVVLTWNTSWDDNNISTSQCVLETVIFRKVSSDFLQQISTVPKFFKLFLQLGKRCVRDQLQHLGCLQHRRVQAR